ncbi:MAG TPA: prephenate dehydrogenase/arogenate dehydrogenase family protein [Kofleriaceae bacterium]|nr:prephenate dehydrogenase/arogenate dehydrogenase family protein [Kofleriaceae bacterium]
MSSVDPDPTLDQLRSDLGAVDRELLALVATRQRLASEIGRVKRERGIPTRNYRQETEVIERARAAAAEHGVSPDTAAELMLLLIRSSLTVQEQDLVAATGEGSGRRVLVIGGAGKMGRWTTRFLRSQGFTVEIADPGARAGDGADTIYTDWHQATLDHDIIVVAAPLAISNDILHELAALAPRGLVFDIGSLKSPLRSGLLACRDAGLSITSVHPMFGPDTELLTGRHVIFVDLGVAEANRQARELFTSTMALQVAMDLESHDRLIAYILGLSHALNIAFVTALVESGESAPKLAQLSSTTFDAQLGIAARVAEENPDLYFEIQSLNDYGTESLSALLYAVERIRSVVRAGDATGFRTLMERGRDYLRGRRPAEDRAP